MKPPTFEQFTREARRHGWGAERIARLLSAEDWRDGIETRIDFARRLFDPRFAKMVIPYREERDRDRLITANAKVLQEESLREQVREEARRRVSDTMSASETNATQIFKKEINHPAKIDQGDKGPPEEVSPDDETKELLLDQK